MASYSISRKEMIEPVERMYEREYGNDYGMFEVVEEAPEQEGEGNIDLVYVQGDSEQLHVIRVEEDYDDCIFNTDRGIFSLQDVEANYRWIALPIYELREGEEQWNDRMKNECKERGIGIIVAQKKGRGFSAKTSLEAEHREGYFLSEYGNLEEKWRQHNAEDETPEGFKVVEYYNQ